MGVIGELKKEPCKGHFLFGVLGVLLFSALSIFSFSKVLDFFDAFKFI